MMTTRILQERLVFDNGIKGEWEVSPLRFREAQTDRDFRDLVTELNRAAKKEGRCTQYRSVPVED